MNRLHPANFPNWLRIALIALGGVWLVTIPFMFWRKARYTWLPYLGAGTVVLIAAAAVAGGASEEPEPAATGNPQPPAAARATAEATTPPASQPSPTPSPSPTPTPEPTPTSTPEPAVTFDPGTVQVYVTSETGFGRRIEVHFTDLRPNADYLALARSCADHQLEAGYGSVYCFAFAAAADFEHAQVNETSGGMTRLCWSARWGVPFDGEGSGQRQSDEVYDLSGCPGATGDAVATLPVATPPPTPASTPDVGRCFSPWDGNLDALEDLIRPLLNDEGSMQTHETRFTRTADENGEHFVYMEYSANNAFGARIKVDAVGAVRASDCRVRLIAPGF